jgi:hypothetical protein
MQADDNLITSHGYLSGRNDFRNGFVGPIQATLALDFGHFGHGFNSNFGNRFVFDYWLGYNNFLGNSN